jgi:hypothetical protein
LPGRPRPARGSRARDSARTIRVRRDALAVRGGLHLRLQGLRQTEGDAGAEVVSRRRCRRLRACGFVDDDELGIAAREPHLDVPRRELLVERESRLGEDVEEAELEGGRDRRGESFARRRRGLVTERSRGREVGLDRLNVSFDVHVTSI